VEGALTVALAMRSGGGGAARSTRPAGRERYHVRGMVCVQGRADGTDRRWVWPARLWLAYAVWTRAPVWVPSGRPQT